MTFAELGAVGEFVGSLLTLVTLAYLAIQIRQNNAQQRREQLIAIQHGYNDVLGRIQDPIAFESFVRGLVDGAAPIDRGTATIYVVQYLNQFQVVCEMHRQEAIDGDQFALWLNFAAALVAAPNMRRWWEGEDGRLAFHAEVRELIDDRLRDTTDPVVPINGAWSALDASSWPAREGGVLLDSERHPSR